VTHPLPRVPGHEQRELGADWELAASAPGAHPTPAGIGELGWIGMSAPVTAAGALSQAGLWRHGDERDFDAEDWWFRTRFSAPAAAEDEQVVLCFDGIATVADVFLNGTQVLHSESMFATSEVDVGAALTGENELAICCRALTPLLETPRRPRARWRTRLAHGGLRFHRTMLLGRTPGMAPEPAAVGPWRPVRLVRRRALAAEAVALSARMPGSDGGGVVRASVRLRPLDGRPVDAATLELTGPSGSSSAALEVREEPGAAGPSVLAAGELHVSDVALWWPHTHGEPVLYSARLLVERGEQTTAVDLGRVGFRTIAAGARPGHDIERDGIDLHVNGVPVFARGAVWTPVDPVGLAPPSDALRDTLRRVCEGGMNMLRISGTGTYESPEFHAACDELGLLVWQDFMFANFDYPVADEAFRGVVEREATELLARLSASPSLAILCGNSEIEQQVAMLGLDPALGRGELFGEILPRLIEESDVDADYVPSTPCGGVLPFRPGVGVANYYGVGGYRRGLEDTRRAEVRFAAECLALSNVPDEAGVEAIRGAGAAGAAVHDPAWKAGVPRDAGTGWDFEDVRDHYLELLFGVRALDLRSVDHDRYLELSRAVSGEVMSEVFGEWRRRGSPCGGGLVLWLADLRPGAGWGVLDHARRPKPAYHHLRRALAPIAVWTTDEGLGGIAVHAANDRRTPLRAELRVTLYRDGTQLLATGSRTIELAAHSGCEFDCEEILGRFADAGWAYRFGAPEHDVLVASLEQPGEPPRPFAQAFRFPAGRPLQQHGAADIGLGGELVDTREGWELRLHTRRLAYGVRVHVDGFEPDDDALTLEPGVPRTIALRRARAGDEAPAGTLSALNVRGRVPLQAPSAAT
jgi:beta-mannosidase